jgi:MscS family membrane protein
MFIAILPFIATLPNATVPAAAHTADGEGEESPAVLTLLGPVFELTPWWGWVILFLGIFFGLVAGRIAQIMLRRASDRLTARGWTLRSLAFYDAASPANLALITLGLNAGLWFGLNLRQISPPLDIFANRIVQFLYIFALGWLLYNLVDLMDVWLRRITEADQKKLAAQLVPLIRKAMRIFIVIVFTLFIAQNVFEVNITAWLAGLGIAGLAVSLAGQESIKNLFGSVTVLLDKPFIVGDRIVLGDIDGFVEEIGFRSTKVRTFTGHLITIPNMKFIDSNVENISARPFIRRTLNVTVTYDTSPEMVERAAQIIRDLLAEPQFAEAFNLEDRPPRVFFSDFNSDSLNIAVNYWYFLDADAGRDWWAYQAHAEMFNHRLLRAFNEAGIDFAFPTQTLHLAGDPKRRLAVEVETAKQ